MIMLTAANTHPTITPSIMTLTYRCTKSNVYKLPNCNKNQLKKFNKKIPNDLGNLSLSAVLWAVSLVTNST